MMKIFANEHCDYLEDHALFFHGHKRQLRCLLCPVSPSLYEKTAHRKLVLNFLKESFSHMDGRAYWVPFGDIFILFQGSTHDAETGFRNFADVMDGFRAYDVQSSILDLSVEWDLFESLFAAQCKKAAHVFEKRKRVVLSDSIEQGDIARNVSLREGRQKPLLMIVEDDPFTSQLIRASLGRAFDVVSADTAQRALSLYKHKLPDLVFMDIELPDGDGEMLTRNVCAADPDAFIVMLSSHSMKEKVLNCLQNGAKGFVAKPFTKNRLQYYLDAYVRGHIGNLGGDHNGAGPTTH